MDMYHFYSLIFFLHLHWILHWTECSVLGECAGSSFSVDFILDKVLVLGECLQTAFTLLYTYGSI